MSHFDVFNGDADGLCSLVQLRLVEPCRSTLVTGVKRDIALLERVAAGAGDSVTALDVSLHANRAALERLLAGGVRVQYFDHHFAGDVPTHPLFSGRIETGADVCTGILVDRYLEGAQRPWAVVAAFGDNLIGAARALAQPLGLDKARLSALQTLGEALSYNGYGDAEADLIVHPAELYQHLYRSGDPFAFIAEAAVFDRIVASMREDLARAQALMPAHELGGAAVYILPDQAWSRRVRGVYANELANRSPTRAHAILTPNGTGSYMVSVRAPLATKVGADALCRQFATGGGRTAAAGINDLPYEKLPQFLQALAHSYAAAN